MSDAAQDLSIELLLRIKANRFFAEDGELAALTSMTTGAISLLQKQLLENCDDFTRDDDAAVTTAEIDAIRSIRKLTSCNFTTGRRSWSVEATNVLVFLHTLAMNLANARMLGIKGTNIWSRILRAGWPVFSGFSLTAVDLKDRWRVVTRKRRVAHAAAVDERSVIEQALRDHASVLDEKYGRLKRGREDSSPGGSPGGAEVLGAAITHAVLGTAPPSRAQVREAAPPHESPGDGSFAEEEEEDGKESVGNPNTRAAALDADASPGSGSGTYRRDSPTSPHSRSPGSGSGDDEGTLW